MAFDPKFFDDLSRSIADSVPADLAALGADAQRNIKAALQATFAKLDLVTREEFDVQSQVLARTRARLTELEQHVAELEKALSGKSG